MLNSTNLARMVNLFALFNIRIVSFLHRTYAALLVLQLNTNPQCKSRVKPKAHPWKSLIFAGRRESSSRVAINREYQLGKTEIGLDISGFLRHLFTSVECSPLAKLMAMVA